MYKDKDRQREANRQAQARFKAKGITSQGITDITPTKEVIPDGCIDCRESVSETLRGTRLKRGLDIKCFEDLPQDVQQTITMMSTADGKIDPIEKANRTAIAIHYQHMTGRYEPTSDQGFTKLMAHV